MNKPINIKAAQAVACLLESDLEFFNTLSSNRSELEITGSSRQHEYTEDSGTLRVWWSAEIEARSWGIKDISFHITKLILDISREVPDAEGDLQPGEEIHYEYPEVREPVPANPEAADKTNALRLARPAWKILTSAFARSSLTFHPQATVDLEKHVIEIEF